jgi:transcriptional regulator with XRE-family HTH domain
MPIENPLAAHLAKELRRLRGESSYGEFAKKLGISKSLAHKLETGEGATLNTVYRLACGLKVRVEDLLGAEELKKRRGRRG